MWGVFITINGAYVRFIAFTDELERVFNIETEPEQRTRFQAAFKRKEYAEAYVNLINSATF